MKSIVIFSLSAIVLFGGPISQPAVAETDLSRFSLVDAVPSDAFITVSARTNPERQFLNEYWEEVFKAFHESGILTDVWDLIMGFVDDEDLDAVEDLAERFGDLCGKVKFNDLFEKEFLYAARFETSLPGIPMLYEGVIVGRSDKKKARANYDAITAVLYEVARLIDAENEGSVSVTENKEHGATIAMLGIPEAPGIGFGVAVREDVVVISLVGEAIMDNTLALLDGTSKAKRLKDSKRFQSAFSKLPAAEDTIVFFDLSGMLGTMQSMFDGIKKASVHSEPEKGNGETEKARVFNTVCKLMDDISIFDYIATVEWTDGYRVYSDTIIPVKDGATASPLYDVFTSGKPLKRFEKYIPKEAESFTVSAGIDLNELYTYLISFVDKQVPGGSEFIEQFAELQEEWELDIGKDVLGLIDGASASFTIDKDFVFMIKVTDEKKVEKQLDRLIEFANGLFGPEQSLITSTVPLGKERKIRQISHPMMMMAGIVTPPVIGCVDGYLMVGSSAKTVKTCLNTADDKHPNITKNKRWQKEAVIPDESIHSISFTDETKFAQQMQELIGGLSMGFGMVGMMGMMGGDMPPEAQAIFSEIPTILAKLGPVAGKLNFYQSSASYETFDGKMWCAHQVQNYKKPKPKEKKSEHKEKPKVKIEAL